MSHPHSPGSTHHNDVRESRARRPAPRDVAVVCGLMAVTAGAGAVGLIGGGLDLGATVTGRLPADSTQLAGVALAVVVVLPMTAAAVASARRSPAAADLTVL